MIAASRRWANVRPAHAWSIRDSSSAVKTGISFSVTAGGAARPSGPAGPRRREGAVHAVHPSRRVGPGPDPLRVPLAWPTRPVMATHIVNGGMGRTGARKPPGIGSAEMTTTTFR